MAYENEAQGFEDMKDYPRAAFALEHARGALDKMTDEPARANLGAILVRLGIARAQMRDATAGEWTRKGLELLGDLAERPKADVLTLNLAAAAFATAEPQSYRDGARATAYAKRAVELTHAADPEVLRTLAIAYQAAGNRELAHETAQKALALVGDLRRSEHQPSLVRTLSTF